MAGCDPCIAQAELEENMTNRALLTLVLAFATCVARPLAADSPRIVNIINFIRAVEPREPVDLLRPVREQIRLVREHNLPATFLLQYDALVDERFVSLLKSELRDTDEIGAWLEIVQPQVEAAGLKWRGRFPWDWHTDVGFTIGYLPAEREKLMDVYMQTFRRTFGRLPASVGCWLLDAHTMNYLADRYGVTAACICKDQTGTDGYTLWGGYWNQAYYPSRLNACMPAQTPASQNPIPIFRMLGSDPIYQYDTGLGEAAQGVVSLEPVYVAGGGGGHPAWVRWFFDLTVNAPCLAFAYTQVGQENSFGWPAMEKGLTDQVRLLADLARQGKVRVETLGQSGRWFRDTFPQTPATAVVALDDWKKEGRRSVWYNSRFYRVNLYWEKDAFRIRDIHLFDERYPERYLNERVTTHACTYDTLPVMDGFNWSTRDHLAGVRPVALAADGRRTPLPVGAPRVSQPTSDTLLVSMPLQAGGTLEVRCEPAVLRFTATGAASHDWVLEATWNSTRTTGITRVESDRIRYRHSGFDYALRADAGTFRTDGGSSLLWVPRQREIVLEMKR